MLATPRPRYHSLDLGAQGLCWPTFPWPRARQQHLGDRGRGLRLPSSFSVEGLSVSPHSSQSRDLWVVTGRAHLSWAAQEPEEWGLSLVLGSLPLRVAGLYFCPLRMTTPSRQSPFLPTLHPGGLVTAPSSGIW